MGSLESFTLTIPWNLAKLVKNFLGIIVRRHHTDQKNGIVERAVRRVKEGTSAVLLQSGLNEKWWADSMECNTYLRNVQDLLSDEKTPNERRFGKPFKGPIIPFGSLVEYYPISAKDQSKNPSIWKESLTWIVPWIRSVREGIWKGDILVADIEELVTVDASEIYLKRLNAKEVIFLKENGKFIFPVADGRIKSLGGDQELRTSTLVRHRPNQGESNIDFLGESEGSLPQPQDSFPDAGEAINDFWSLSRSFMYRHHVEPRVKLYSPREESFPIPLKYIDVSRTTHTNLDVKQEKSIDDYWNIDGSRVLSDPWTGFTQFTLLDEKAPDGYTWSGGRLTRKQLTSRPDDLWPELWKSMGKNAKKKEKEKWSNEKLHLENARKLRGISFSDPEDKEFKETIKNARKKLETSVAPAMPCKIMKNCGSGASDKGKTKLACILYNANVLLCKRRTAKIFKNNSMHRVVLLEIRKHDKECQPPCHKYQVNEDLQCCRSCPDQSLGPRTASPSALALVACCWATSSVGRRTAYLQHQAKTPQVLAVRR